MKKSFTIKWYVPVVLFVLLITSLFPASCNHSESLFDIPSGTAVKTVADSSPKYEGFSLALSTGTWWEYAFLGGAFKITLGNSKTISGVTAYELIITGDAGDFTPRWKYLASANNQILGSVDGITLQVICDGQNGIWQGGGFFASFPAKVTMELSETTLFQKWDWQMFPDYTPAFITGQSEEDPLNEVIDGQVFYGDSSYSCSEYEYYKSGIGLIGYNYDSSSYVSGGTFDMGASSSTTKRIRLISTSLTASDGTLVENSPWTLVTSLPRRNAVGISVAAMGNRIYVFGGKNPDASKLQGIDNVDIYDTITGTWTTGAPMPWGRYHATSVAGEGVIYVMGGEVYDEYGEYMSRGEYMYSLWVYDPSADIWHLVSDPPKEYPILSKYGAYMFDVPIFYVDHNYILMYFPDYDMWDRVKNLPVEGEAVAMATDGEKLYMIGERVYNDWRHAYIFLEDCWMLEPYEEWVKVAPMNLAKEYPQAVFVNGKLYVFGSVADSEEAGTVEMYNPLTDTWTTKSPLPPLVSPGAAVVVNNKIYTFFGTALFEYNPLTDN
jgi:hypothetical protein